MPLGKESVSGAVSLAAVLFALRKVIVRVETAPEATVAGVNDLCSLGAMSVGRELAVKVATAGVLLLPLLVCKAPMGSVLMQMPMSLAVTLTVTLQDPMAGIEPPVRVTVELPWMATTVPPQVVLAFPETSRPPGKESVSGAMIAAAVPFGLLKVMTSAEAPPVKMLVGLKALLIPTTEGMTVKVATAAPALFPRLVCSAPAGIELM